LRALKRKISDALYEIAAVDDCNETALIDDQGAVDVVVAEERSKLGGGCRGSVRDGTGDHCVARPVVPSGFRK
jgi:hypothetical protein